jgi:hypothetical protein
MTLKPPHAKPQPAPMPDPGPASPHPQMSDPEAIDPGGPDAEVFRHPHERPQGQD